MKTKKKTLEELNGPLSDEEMKRYAVKMQIVRHIGGNISPLLSDQERVFKEVLYYRSRPRLIVTMDEHHSSMGTSAIARCKDDKGVERHVGTDFPMRELGFSVARGQRFMVSVDLLAPDKKMKPRKNPFLTPKPKPKGAPRVFMLNETHTTHITKAQARKERREARRKKA